MENNAAPLRVSRGLDIIINARVVTGGLLMADSRHCTNPEQDIRAFHDALIYNWVIAGTEAHAKNYNLMLDGNTVAFAPLYDIASWLPYTSDRSALAKTKLAMKIGKAYTLQPPTTQTNP